MKKLKEQEKEKLLCSEEAEADKAKEAKKTDAQSEEKDDKYAEFEKLIKGEFKEQFEQRIKEIIKRRFKESSESNSPNAQNDEIMSMLMMKYGIKDNNLEMLTKAIESDDGYIRNEAEKSGIDTETLKRIKQLEYENEMIKNKMKEEKEALKMQETVKSWMKDGEFLKEQYPDFDLSVEAENPDFVNLLKGGANLKNAYLALHHDEIVKALVEQAAAEAQTQTADSIRARSMRPLENGMSGKSTALFKTDVSKLTPEQRAEIARRAARGEKISF